MEKDRARRDEPVTDDDVRGDLSISGWRDSDQPRNPIPPAPSDENAREGAESSSSPAEGNEGAR